MGERLRKASGFACVAVALVVASGEALAAPAPTTSRYMTTVNTTTLYNLGCTTGGNRGAVTPQTGVVVLDFGMPMTSNGLYGASIFSSMFVSTSQIAAAVQSFLQGYWDCSPSYPTITLAIGTTNNGSNVSAAHAKAWANMVTQVDSWIGSKGYRSQESVAGAIDIETNWNSRTVSRAWVDAYASVYTRPYYNFGDAGGCPSSGGQTSTAGYCNNGWTQDDVYYVSWGAAPAYAVPEIYRTDGLMARQRQQISLYRTSLGPHPARRAGRGV